MTNLLIVDDDKAVCDALASLVVAEGFTADSAGTLREAELYLGAQRPDAILADLMLPDGDGVDLLAGADIGEAPFIVMTGRASVDTAIHAMRAGATDYLTKPVDPQHLLALLRAIEKQKKPRPFGSGAAGQVTESGGFGRLIGTSRAMRHMYHELERVARTDASVFLVGESGTGKELVAQTLHELSARREAPFTPVNCGAISPMLLESEFFGHEKGSFTGAHRQHQGYFDQAGTGTLFLDEVTEMPVELQVKLLRTLESGAYLRVGGHGECQANCRIIAATNRDPLEAVAEGRFRVDLFHRLNVFPIVIPPLRERVDDIDVLAARFLAVLNARYGTERRFGEGALLSLRAHSWPGNVRELRNVVHRAHIMATNDLIDDIGITLVAAPEPAPDPSIISFHVGTSIDEVERELIFATLLKCDGVKKKTAQILGVSLKTLYNKLEYYEATGKLPESIRSLRAVGKPPAFPPSP
ncbi:sigma-54-dependent transcriptional regulator [Cupriavidus malaysiensis]|uniref:Sigma-54-dependent Fis family transcriptional regulator n=1 Tax=Cupriavidus malaysiensis TaxID=367825 RepID=A0A1D9IEW7_9BURK|nr:sigma-54 dependent transcriptional regulator [Cupriavidus malaysiensis]AOZ10620.1 sigma-54-dependent Fis family transcriptional regulator [Cupriavidus malaysiensis]